MLAAMKIVQNYVDLVANISVKKSVRNTSPGSVWNLINHPMYVMDVQNGWIAY